MVAQLKDVTKIVSQEESSGELSSTSSVSSLQRLRKLLVMLVLLGSNSAVPRQRRPLVKRRPFDPKQTARPAPTLHQLLSRLEKLGTLESQSALP